jgi:hypothetical protein
LAAPGDELRFRPASQAAKVGYFTPHCIAKAGALRLLHSKASRTSRLYWAV